MDFFRFFEPGDHNFSPILLKLVSFCWEDQIQDIDTSFSPLATLTVEKSPAKNGPNVLTIAVYLQHVDKRTNNLILFYLAKTDILKPILSVSVSGWGGVGGWGSLH